MSNTPEQPAAPADPAAAPVHPAHSANPPQRRSLLPVVAALAVGALIGGAAGGGVVAALYGGQSGIITSGGNPTTVTVNNPDNATEVTGVVARAMPSIVTLSVSATNGAAGSGSGVILSDDGYVLTNSHVATLDGATTEPTIRVTTHDGRIWNATLVGADPIADLAVVRLEGATGLQPIEFGDSDALNVGDRAIAIGAPLGLSGTVTNGIVSALNRSITVRSSAVPDAPSEMAPDDGDTEGDLDEAPPFDFWNFAPPGDAEPQRRPSAPISLSVIQTDAAINPGNSGGALLDSDGRLIGINVAIATAGGTSTAGSIGVGFSIPANFAQRIATELIETGRASHGLLGATVTDASNTATSPVVGALIDQVSPGGPAELAGLRAGDIVTEFNGVPITNRIDLTAQVRVLAGGDDATLVYVRGGQAREVRVTLDELQ
ncbi:putative serine protease PepD [Microcella alkaliphila]|uniref:Putative serine protease PepD n=1 Tax=Microcella alkaliphila TaxID=279828 RepID=A0A4Q7TSD8_9MICO|nr:trypsin-like peptidase domain-containing protein [Microcella alkaliphila]RZT62472.1 putative serine protease PepD [Microcella alkaliphila]